ncbi:MAG: LptF/LptG family permease [Paracoccaceae bacterium]
MNIFERYMLVQQIKPFIFFSFVLVGILWLIQALPRLDDVISNGQSGIVFLDIALLILPQVMLLVLPIAAFASTLYAIHKLITESELIIFMNAGLSNIKLIRPVIFFGGMILIFLFFLSIYLVPISQNKLRTKIFEIRQEFSNKLIKDQQFFHPVKGVTIYIREANDLGELKGIFITDARRLKQTLTYSAKEAIMGRTEEGLMLVMQYGMLQVTDSKQSSLTTLKFNRMGFKLNNFLPSGPRKNIAPVEILPLKILQNPSAYYTKNSYRLNEYISEAHTKLAAPLAPLALTLLALALFLISGFNRRGYFSTIIIAIGLAILVQSLTSAFRTTVVKDASLYWILYLPSLFCILLSLCIILFSKYFHFRYLLEKEVNLGESK